MSQNDYVIANQTTPLFRADLNSALQALASNSSGATAPATTYANMLWYDTAANILKMRNEANSVWINLGTLDQSLGTFTASGALPLATQVQAEAGTDNTTLMTPLRTSQAIDAQVVIADPTTSQVASATAGIASNAVGSYHFARNMTSELVTYNPGSTIAGSKLRSVGIRSPSTISLTFVTNTTALSGTWRVMGYMVNQDGGDNYTATLVLRIS